MHGDWHHLCHSDSLTFSSHKQSWQTMIHSTPMHHKLCSLMNSLWSTGHGEHSVIRLFIMVCHILFTEVLGALLQIKSVHKLCSKTLHLFQLVYDHQQGGVLVVNTKTNDKTRNKKKYWLGLDLIHSRPQKTFFTDFKIHKYLYILMPIYMSYMEIAVEK